MRASLQLRATPVRMTLAGVAVLSPVFAAFVLVLVAACANASNVMLARANARHREIGIRLSIGASRGRVVRQLVTEGLLVAVLAGLAGLALAGAAAAGRRVPVRRDAAADSRAARPIRAARLRLSRVPVCLRGGRRGHDPVRAAAGAAGDATVADRRAARPAERRDARLHAAQLLVTSQVAVSLVLLIVAATLVRNGTAIRATDLGLDTGGVISVRPGRSDKALIAAHLLCA